LHLYAQEESMQYNDNQIIAGYIVSEEKASKITTGNIDVPLIIFAEQKNNDTYNIYAYNNTDSIMRIFVEIGKLHIIQEAKDKDGTWRPIEYWRWQSLCGNSYGMEKVSAKTALKAESKRYEGNYKTEIRFKLLNNDTTHYSNSMIGYISRSQFKIPHEAKNYLYRERRKLTGKKIADETLFLTPKYLKEYLEILKTHRKKLSEQNQKKRN
jgi:hypothetical protein